MAPSAYRPRRSVRSKCRAREYRSAWVRIARVMIEETWALGEHLPQCSASTSPGTDPQLETREVALTVLGCRPVPAIALDEPTVELHVALFLPRVATSRCKA